MFIPVSHEETTVRRQPWVTFGAMALCTAVLVAAHWSGDADVYADWGLTPRAPKAHTYLTYMFVHAGWGHLLSNLLILFLAGPPLEDRWGRPFFAAFTLMSGLLAGGFYALAAGTSGVPLVGASGAIAGLMGASMVRFWTTKIRFFYFIWLLRPITGTFWAPVWAMLPLWFVSQAAMAGAVHSAGVASGVAYSCHVGGFVFGAAVALAVRQWRLEERYFDERLDARVTVSDNRVIGEAMDLRIQGDAAGAFELLRDAAEARPDDPDTVNAFWELACDLRRVDDAVPAMLRILKQGLAAGDGAQAARCWEDLAERAPEARADRASLMRLVPVFLAEEKPTRAAQVLRQIVEPAGGELTTGQAFRVLEMARDVDPGSALVAARRALAAPDLPESKRERIVALVSDLEKRGATPPEAPARPTAQAPPAPAPSGHLDIELEYDAVYDFTLPSASDSAPVLAPRELDATGSLVNSDTLEELLPDSVPVELWNDDAPAPLVGLSPPSEGEELTDPEASNYDLPAPFAAPLGAATPGASPPSASGVRPLDPSASAPAALAPLPPSGAAGLAPLEPDAPPPPPSGSSGLPPLSTAPDGAVAPPPHQDRALDVALAASQSVSRFLGVKVIEASPLALGADGIRLKRAEGKSGSVAYAAIQAIAVAAVRGLSDKPVLLIDLVMNWHDAADGHLRVVRLRSDAFDVRAVMPEAARSIDGFRALQEQILARSGAVPLPDLDAARGRPYRSYDDLDAYQREALEVG